MRGLGSFVCLALAACTAAASPTSPGSATPAAAEPLAQAADGHRLFAELDRRAGREGNVFLSPISVEQAFGLLHAGSAGETRAQLEAFFDWPAGEAADRALMRQRETLLGHGTDADIRLANALWLSDAFRFRPSYLAATREFYGATAETLDFAGDPTKSAQRVNRWAADKTNGLINKVVSPDLFTDALAALLTNALYFEANWQSKFPGFEMRPFLFGDGHEEPFRLMTQTQPFVLAEHRGWRAIRLPYRGGRFAMDVVMPDDREVMSAAPPRAILTALDVELSAGDPHHVALELPRFEIDYEISLKAPLAASGLAVPFDPDRADLSPMAEPGQRSLFVGDATHFTKLQVYEDGTKAAAVTVLSIMVVSAPALPENPVPFVVDRPFVAVIRDLETREVLFIGRIADPQPFTPRVEETEED